MEWVNITTQAELDQAVREISARQWATTVAVSSGVGCKRCGCRMRAPLDDLCAPCREKVGGAPNCYTRT